MLEYEQQSTTAPMSSTESIEPLTYEKLSALYEYLKPERLEIEGQTIEVHGYNIHREHNPPGFIVLTEKKLPDDKTLRGGKLIILDLNSGRTTIYDPSMSNKIHISTCSQLKKVPCPAGKSLHEEATTEHWWSGWPGAYCMKCGAEDMDEICLADSCGCHCHKDE